MKDTYVHLSTGTSFVGCVVTESTPQKQEVHSRPQIEGLRESPRTAALFLSPIAERVTMDHDGMLDSGSRTWY